MCTVDQETGIPHPIVRAVVRFLECVGPFFPAGSLRMGDGAVLEARWGHRESTDADLFCDPRTYVETVRRHGAAMEREVRRVADEREEGEPFVDLVATFSRVGGTAVTILPAGPLLDAPSDRRVPGTNVWTESTADILAGKLVHRLGGAGIVEPRDLFDLAAAERHDPMALRRAVGLLTGARLQGICATPLTLPPRWDVATDKPVLAIAGAYGRVGSNDIVDVLRRSAQAAAEESGPRTPKP